MTNNALMCAIGASLLGAATPAFADQNATARDIAEAYLAAYEQLDYQALREFYTDETVFIDPTSLGLENIGNPIHWQGPDLIISGISAWGLAGLEYNFDRVYEASGRVIFDGATLATYAMADGPVTYNYPIITIVTVENGRVVEHRDYTDFSGASLVQNEEE